MSEEGERLREAMIDAFPECAWWHGRIERRLLLHANELVTRRPTSRPRKTQVWGNSCDFAVVEELTPPREPVPQTDVQARISAQTLALFYGGCILRVEA